MSLLDLWLPILLSAVFVFIVSCVLHVAIPWHRNDYGKLPEEASVLEAMRRAGVTPGQYAFPHAECPKDMATPEMQAKYQNGPVGFAIVLPNGPPQMGKPLVQWFVLALVISGLVAYVGKSALPAGEAYLSVFRVTGTAAMLAYVTSYALDSIWKGIRWSTTGKFMVDGVLYGLVTAGTFGWLWPA